MKLASLDNRTRDGRLMLVRRDGAFYADASDIALNLQIALDGWSEMEPKLQQRSQNLNVKKSSVCRSIHQSCAHRSCVPTSELKKGFGFVQSKPATAFSLFDITPDE